MFHPDAGGKIACSFCDRRFRTYSLYATHQEFCRPDTQQSEQVEKDLSQYQIESEPDQVEQEGLAEYQLQTEDEQRFLLQPIAVQLPQISDENMLNTMEADEMDTNTGHEVEFFEQDIKFTVTYLDENEDEAESVLPDDFSYV